MSTSLYQLLVSRAAQHLLLTLRTFHRSWYRMHQRHSFWPVNNRFLRHRAVRQAKSVFRIVCCRNVFYTITAYNVLFEYVNKTTIWNKCLRTGQLLQLVCSFCMLSFKAFTISLQLCNI